MAGLNLEPCAAYDWCIGHESHEQGEDLELHQGALEPVTVAESTIALDVDVQGSDLSFTLDLAVWSIPADGLESEFADFRAQLDRMEEQAKAFRQKFIEEPKSDAA